MQIFQTRLWKKWNWIISHAIESDCTNKNTRLYITHLYIEAHFKELAFKANQFPLIWLYSLSLIVYGPSVKGKMVYLNFFVFKSTDSHVSGNNADFFFVVHAFIFSSWFDYSYDFVSEF